MLRSRLIYSDSERTVRVIESVETWHGRSSSRCQVAGKIEPLAIIVSGPDGEHAVDVNAQPIDQVALSQLLASARPSDSNR